ncbi:MAG: sigma 54-interacting transcriptional regulator [Spirochaetales bacterium]|nr:sigma 54-interacting transcriptional regulator [Spirochaetales bacterium]
MLHLEVDQKKFETLIEINTEINSNYENVKVLLTKIIDAATMLSGGEASSLMLVDPENNKLYFEIALGTKGEEIKKFSLNMGEGIAGWVAKNNTSLIVNDVDSDQRFHSDISQQVGFKTQSILAVPMRIRDKCIGVLEIINKTDGKLFNEADLKWLEIFANQAAIAIQNAKEYQRVKENLSQLQKQFHQTAEYHPFIGESRVIMEKLKIAQKAAETDSSVLLLGESGTGKELFAERIHLNSNRKDMPLIRINCAALPENLLESELFGHVKGAFTGAMSDRRGRFELADQGTIFLDEIGDMPLGLQVKLLRILQNKSFERLGSNQTQYVNVRIIAATNKDIENEVKEGRFRSDLYYRLNVLPIYIPPLRERIGDVMLLANFFLEKFCLETKKSFDGFSDDAKKYLESYGWPGNVRELENTIERAVVISQNKRITEKDLLINQHKADNNHINRNQDLKDAVNQFKRRFIINALDKNNWKQTVTAEQLGIQRTYLSRLIKELNINR